MRVVSAASRMIRDRRACVPKPMQLNRFFGCCAGLALWVSSTALNVEVSRNPDPDRRHDAEQLLAFVNEVVVPKNADADRARQIAQLGFSAFDSLHLASAERGRADVFLTTDDALLRRARRNAGLLHVRVENPVSWYEEMRL